MPRIILPNGEVKYFESEKEMLETVPPLEDDYGDNEQEGDTGGEEKKDDSKVELDPDVSEGEGEKYVRPAKKYVRDRYDVPAWVANTQDVLKAIPSALVGAPDSAVSAAQHRAQTTRTSDLMNQAFGSFTGVSSYDTAMVGSLFWSKDVKRKYEDATGIDISEESTGYEQEEERVRRGKAYARQGLLDPDYTGGELKEFGIDKDIPIIGTFGKGGALYDSVRPEGDFGRALADFGSILVIAGLTGGKGQGPQTYSALRRTAVLNKLPIFTWKGIRSAKTRQLFWKNAVPQMGYVAKRVGADLPEDLLQEVLIFGLPEPNAQQQKEIDKILESSDPLAIEAYKNLIESDTEAEAKYWMEYAFGVAGGTASAGLFRWTLGSGNHVTRAWRARQAKGLKNFFSPKVQAEVQRSGKTYTDGIAETLEAQQNVVNEIGDDIEVGYLNKQFTNLTRDNFDVLNSQIERLNALRDSIKKVEADQGVIDTTVESVVTLPKETSARFNSLPKLIKAREASIKTLTRKGAAKRTTKDNRTLARYKKQLEEYQQEYINLSKDLDRRGAAAKSSGTVSAEYAEQIRGLREVEEEGIAKLVDDFSNFMADAANVDEARFEVTPDMDMGNDPYYQAYRRVNDLFEQYKTTNDPTLEDKLFETIQREYKTLQELGGRTAPVDTEAYNFLKDEKFQIKEKPLEYGDAPEQLKTLDPVNLEQRMAQIDEIKADKSEGGKKIKKEAREFASRYGRKYEEALAALTSNQSEAYRALIQAVARNLSKTASKKIDLGTLRSISEVAERLAKDPDFMAKFDEGMSEAKLYDEALYYLMRGEPGYKMPDDDLPPPTGEGGGPELPKVPQEPTPGGAIEETGAAPLEQQIYRAPEVKPRKESVSSALERIDSKGELSVVSEGEVTPVDKQTFLSKFIRMSPDGDQAKTAFKRLDDAIRKAEAGLNIPMEERTVINTVGDLINFLNVGRVATEEIVQTAIRDLDKTITFVSEVVPKAVKAIQGATDRATDRLIKGMEADMRATDPERAAIELGEEAPKLDSRDPWGMKQDTEVKGPDKKLEEFEGDPWNDPDVMPLAQGADGEIKVDPDAKGEPIPYTEDPPETALEKRVRIGKDLGLRSKEGPITSSVEDLVKESSSVKAADDFIDTVNTIAAKEEKLGPGQRLEYNFEESKTAAISRTIGKLDTIEQRRAALVDMFANISGKQKNFIPVAVERAVRFAGKLVGVETDNAKFYKLVERHLKATTKSTKALEDVQTQMLTTPLLMYVQSQRVYLLADLLKRTQMTAQDAGDVRAYLAEEAFMLFQQTGTWLRLRNLTSGALAAQKKEFTDIPIAAYRKAAAKKTQDESVRSVQEAIESIQTLRKEMAEEALKDVPTYIGLPSNAKVVQETLEKFLDPNFRPEQPDLDIFNKITSQLALAGINPDALGNVRITGDEIVARNIKAMGLSNPATQTSFLPQTAFYGGGKWINGMLQSKFNKFWNMIPWMQDDEALQAAARESRIWQHFWNAQKHISSNLFEDFYKGRQFNRSIITDAAKNLENTGKYSGSPRASDPFREAAALEVLNDQKPLPDVGLGRILNRFLGKKEAKALANNWHLNWMQFHDMWFKGDSYDALTKTASDTGKGSVFGGTAKTVYDWTPPGWQGSALDKLSGGRISHKQSKLPGGERLGQTFPLFSSETSTELVGGWFASGYSGAKAWIKVLDEVDEMGRPKWVEFNPDGKVNEDFLARVQKVYDDEFTTPITAGIGASAEEISRAFTDEDAQMLAVAMDMMMPMEDDLWGGAYNKIRDLQRSDTGESRVIAQAFFPYVKAPLNAHKHHFYYTQPELFSQDLLGGFNIPGTPSAPWVPMGVPMEAAIGLARKIQGWDGKVMGKTIIGEEGRWAGLNYTTEKDKMAQRLGWFKSKVHHKDPRIRAEARSALTTATAMNFAVMTAVESGMIEATGGQTQSYQEANGAYIPPYHVKIGGAWVPYRWIPYFGELMAFSTNFRDYARGEINFVNQSVVGTSIVAMAATLFDTPAIAGVDTLISSLRNPHKMEDLLIDYIERTMGTGYSPFVYAIGRLTTEAYHARPLYGASPDVLFRSEKDYWKAGEGLDYGEKWRMFGAKRVANVVQIPQMIQRTASRISNATGMLPLIEVLDQSFTDQDPGDFRQAHWYKPGDITYTGPRQRSVMQTMLGRHWPVPHEGDEVDMELFRNGIKPPNQVFRRYGGIVANESMVNKFRRYLGTDFRFSNGDSLHETYRKVISGEVHVPGHPGLFYNDLEDDPRHSLTLDGNYAPWVNRKDILTKRIVLMDIRREAVALASEQFLRGERRIYPGGNESPYDEPTNLKAPDVATQLYWDWREQNPNK